MVLWHHSYSEIKWSSLYLNYNSRYTALTTLGIKQEAEQIMANVFYSTFLNVFFNFCHVFNVFFYFSWYVFYIYGSKWGNRRRRIEWSRDRWRHVMAVGAHVAKFQMVSEQPVVQFTLCFVLMYGFCSPRIRCRWFLQSCWNILKWILAKGH